MSTSTLVAKRYAKALFLLAKEKNNVVAVEKDLKLVSNALQENAELMSFLTHPSVAQSSKLQLVQEVFAKNVQNEVFDLLQLLCDRRRTDAFAEITKFYSKIASLDLGQVDAQIISPIKLSENDIIEIQKKFSGLLGKEVRVETHLNPSLIGGIQVRVGDTLYDGSIAGKLARLEKTLQESQAL
jgi:F-type H+-transporting ATPase subunit delta